MKSLENLINYYYKRSGRCAWIILMVPAMFTGWNIHKSKREKMNRWEFRKSVSDFVEIWKKLHEEKYCKGILCPYSHCTRNKITWNKYIINVFLNLKQIRIFRATGSNPLWKLHFAFLCVAFSMKRKQELALSFY